MNFNGEIDWSLDVAEDGDTVAEKFNILYDTQVELAESYYDYKEKYLKETL